MRSPVHHDYRGLSTDRSIRWNQSMGATIALAQKLQVPGCILRVAKLQRETLRL